MKKQTYEESIKKLEKIVEALEEGSKPLDETLKLFEEGTKLAVYCNTCLDDAEQKIVELTTLESGGATDEQ
ncbi:MAG: exodeoxyribonuclease VII small subunit [Clostridiales bacterium]|nr:exodeoxyribonuclease VII small subunit [Clostridiales bacterium]